MTNEAGPKKTQKNDKKRTIYKSYLASQGVADWETVDAELIRRAIATAALVDGAIRFGVSRDGGAYSLGLYGGGEPVTIWVGGNGDIVGELENVIQWYSDLADERAAEANEKAQKRLDRNK